MCNIARPYAETPRSAQFKWCGKDARMQVLESFSYNMGSEPVDEKSQSADSFMKQAVMKLEEGTVKLTFYNTLEHFVNATFTLFYCLVHKRKIG